MRRFEPDDLLGPYRAFEGRIVFRIGNYIVRQFVMVDDQLEFAASGRVCASHEPARAKLGFGEISPHCFHGSVKNALQTDSIGGNARDRRANLRVCFTHLVSPYCLVQWQPRAGPAELSRTSPTVFPSAPRPPSALPCSL